MVLFAEAVSPDTPSFFFRNYDEFLEGVTHCENDCEYLFRFIDGTSEERELFEHSHVTEDNLQDFLLSV